MKKKILYIVAAFVAIACSCNPDKEYSEVLSRCSVDTVGAIRVLNLHGTWEEMGIQYGFLAKDDIHASLEYMEKRIDGDAGRDSAVRATAGKLFSHYPGHLRAFVRGMSVFSGLDTSALKVVNALEYAEKDFFCSGLAVWGDYAAGNLLYGRNYDCQSYSELAPNILITVFHPSDGSLAGATIGYAGEVYAVNGLNEKGVFFALDNGMPSGGFEKHFDMVPSTVELFDVIFRARSIDDMDRFFNTTRSFASFLIGVADTTTARAYEWCYDGVKRGDLSTPDGLMVITNHYNNPEWTFEVPSDDDSWISLTRYSNLLARAAEHKGTIDVGVLESIMQTEIGEGGSMSQFTRYQFVADPTALTLHVRIPGFCDWQEVRLGKYFE